VNEFAQIAARAFGKEIAPRASGLYRYGDTRHICSDVSRLCALGWSPRRSPEDSVAEYVAWLRRQENIEDVLAYAERTMKEMNVLRKVGAQS
jgi:dTDP-L-rhamnose 4-epimerase